MSYLIELHNSFKESSFLEIMNCLGKIVKYCPLSSLEKGTCEVSNSELSSDCSGDYNSCDVFKNYNKNPENKKIHNSKKFYERKV